MLNSTATIGEVYWSLHKVLQAKRQAAAMAAYASKPPVPITAEMNRTERAIATNAARRAPVKQAEAAEIAAHGNPWSLRSINRTRQAQITNLDPQLAATLKAQAGA